MANKLFDIGYNTLSNAESLEMVVKELDAIVFDIRFVPVAKRPDFHKENIAKRFRQRYYHCKNLGNTSYKQAGKITLVNQEKGLVELYNALKLRNVIILCGCANRDTCHRKDVARLFELRYRIPCIPINGREITTSKLDDTTPVQNPLF